jgi:hypothetical protein
VEGQQKIVDDALVAARYVVCSSGALKWCLIISTSRRRDRIVLPRGVPSASLLHIYK